MEVCKHDGGFEQLLNRSSNLLTLANFHLTKFLNWTRFYLMSLETNYHIIDSPIVVKVLLKNNELSTNGRQKARNRLLNKYPNRLILDFSNKGRATKPCDITIKVEPANRFSVLKHEIISHYKSKRCHVTHSLENQFKIISPEKGINVSINFYETNKILIQGDQLQLLKFSAVYSKINGYNFNLSEDTFYNFVMASPVTDTSGLDNSGGEPVGDSVLPASDHRGGDGDDLGGKTCAPSNSQHRTDEP